MTRFFLCARRGARVDMPLCWPWPRRQPNAGGSTRHQRNSASSAPVFPIWCGTPTN